MKSLDKKDTINDTNKDTNQAEDSYVFRNPKGLSVDVVKAISEMKGEPSWMLDARIHGYKTFLEKKLPSWGPSLQKLDFEDIHYYVKPTDGKYDSWDDVPLHIKNTFERLGIPKAEREHLAGVKAQYESEVVYGSLVKDLKDEGVVFLDMDSALRLYPDLVKTWFGKIVPASDNKFAALNTAFWSGGSFIYIPKGVRAKNPLQTYFRINSKNMGQFERTLIIADEGSFVHYVEGCSAPVYSSNSLHAAVVEVVVMPEARVRYTTIQNWSEDVYNLVTKRARVDTNGIMEWVDGNLGSKVTMKYPSCYLVGKGAYGEVLSLAYADGDRHLDAGAKMIHFAPDTGSKIISKSVSSRGGTSSYRGLVQIMPGAANAKAKVECDALILDEKSTSNTFPVIKTSESTSQIEHEATVSKISGERLFYLTSRGLSEEEASSLIINGFIEPIIKELPLEYAVELNRLIELSMEGSVG